MRNSRELADALFKIIGGFFMILIPIASIAAVLFGGYNMFAHMLFPGRQFFHGLGGFVMMFIGAAVTGFYLAFLDDYRSGNL